MKYSKKDLKADADMQPGDTTKMQMDRVKSPGYPADVTPSLTKYCPTEANAYLDTDFKVKG